MKPEDYYDKVSNIYDSLYEDEVSKMENNIVKNTLRKNIKRHHKILDLGCGTGLFLELYYLYNYIGIDCSRKMIYLARKKYPCGVFKKYNIDKGLPYKDNTFDAVVSLFSSASHFADFPYILTETQRILKNSGYVYIMCLAKKNSRNIEYVTRNAPKELGNTSARTYTIEELKELFKGFLDLKVYYLTDQQHTIVVEGRNER